MRESTDYTCPYCGSSDTRSYRAIWESGTVSSTGHGKVDTGKLLAGDVSIQSQSISKEARLAEKPSKATNIRMEIGIPLAIVCPIGTYLYSLLPILGQESAQRYLPLIVTLCVVVGLSLWLWGRADANEKDKDLEQRIANWERSWRCDRCAKSFLIAPASDESVAKYS